MLKYSPCAAGCALADNDAVEPGPQRGISGRVRCYRYCASVCLLPSVSESKLRIVRGSCNHPGLGCAAITMIAAAIRPVRGYRVPG